MREERKVILGENLEDLKIRAERARKDLNKLANEAAEHSPEGVKEILETLISSTDLKDISELKDYHVGIGYGSFVFASGFTAFMLAGSISAVRFGVVLGGALVALGIRSRRAQNNGEAYDLPLKGQTAIATVIFLRKLTLLFQRSSLFQFVSAVIRFVTMFLLHGFHKRVIIWQFFKCVTKAQRMNLDD
ncbi:Protein FATTY ACID EXPORT 3, chloroplastic [Linum perenne]